MARIGRGLGFSVLVLIAACSSDPPNGSISIVTGEEADTFSRAPAPTMLVVDHVAVDDAVTEVARLALPTDSIDLGTPSKDDIAQYTVTGLDASGKTIVRGESLFFQLGALENAGLDIFVSRTGELARVPRSPAAPFDAPAFDVVFGRYIVAANLQSTQIYDLLFWKTNAAPPTLPRAAKSIVAYGTVVAAIDETGLSTLDLSNGTSFDIPAPAGGTYAEIAGGKTVRTATNVSYVVGATRSGAASQRILQISSDGVVSFSSLTIPRKGACATYVEGRGLVVVGGDATGAGAELLVPGSTQATPLAYPPDATESCGAAWLDQGRVLVAKTKAYVLDLACAATCVPLLWKGALPFALRAEATGFAADAAMVAGDDASGSTHLFRVSAEAFVEIPIKVARKGARLVSLPRMTVAIVGGAPQIELYRD